LYEIRPKQLRNCVHIIRNDSDVTYRAMYDDEKFNRYNGYRLLAVDGTTLEMPNYEHLREYFGHTGDKSKTVRARASALFDIENDMIITTEIANYHVDERTLAKKHLDKLKSMGNKNDLILYDRGYPSREIETIVTSILDKFSIDELKEIYFKRWGYRNKI
jgi:hypothetical protein